jgi:hypothetical protein
MAGWTEEQLAAYYAALKTPEGCSGEDCPPGPVPLLPEWMIEAECTKLLEQDGWRSLRTDPVSDRGRGKGFGEVGMADHLYIRYNASAGATKILTVTDKVLWIEFKSAKGKPKKHQIEWHTKERARGALTLIAGVDFPASVNGFMGWYRASGLNRSLV